MSSTRLRSLVWATFSVVWLLCTPALIAQNSAKFRTEFEAAVKSNDYEAKKRIVLTDRLSAQLCAMELYEPEYCKALIDGDKTKAADILANYEQLATSYKVEFKGEKFLANRKAWVEALDEAGRQTCFDARGKYVDAWGLQDKARRSATPEDWAAAFAALEAVAQQFLTIKDYYWAAASFDWIRQGYKSIEDQFGEAYAARKGLDLAAKPGGLERDYTGFGESIDQMSRKEVVKKPELIDITLDIEAAKKKYEKDYADSLVIKPAAVNPGDKNAPKGATTSLVPPTSPDAEDWVEDKGFKPTTYDVTTKMTPFCALRNPEGPWPELFLRGNEFKKGEKPAPLGRLPKATASFDKKMIIDVDGDKGKAPEIELKLKGKPELIKFDYKYDDDTTQKLTFIAQLLPSKFNIFGKEFNFADPTMYRFYFNGATGVTGKVRGHTMIFVDSSGNGTFDDSAEDIVVIDAGTKNERIEPFSQFIFLDQGGGLFPYEIRIPSKRGTEIRSRPYKKELVPLSLDYKGKVIPRYLIAHGSGEFSPFFFNLIPGLTKPIWVPPSSYGINHGYIVGPDSKKEGFAMITKGRGALFKVESGKQSIWPVGGAGEKGFWMTTKVTRASDDPNAIEVSGMDIRVFGTHSEEYHNFYPTRVMPSVEVRKNDANGPVVVKKDMQPPTGDNLKFEEVWFPAKLVLKGIPKTEKVVVKLRAEHPLLGKFESDWLIVANE